MRLLLDTHVLIWSCFDRKKLSPTVETLLLDTSNDLFYSAASIWEIAIKVSIGKLYIPGGIEQMVLDIGSQLLAMPIHVNNAHAAAVVHLPQHHSDPFDKLLAAQSLYEKLPIVSIDDKLDGFGVTRLW